MPCGRKTKGTVKMRKLTRQYCSILSLVLKRKWYCMIESGKKLEEYRDDSAYWRRRINNWITRGGFPVVEFRLGYGKKAPRMWFTVNAVFSRAMALTHTWGEPWCRHFAIVLGSRVEVADAPEA